MCVRYWRGETQGKWNVVKSRLSKNKMEEDNGMKLAVIEHSLKASFHMPSYTT